MFTPFTGEAGEGVLQSTSLCVCVPREGFLWMMSSDVLTSHTLLSENHSYFIYVHWEKECTLAF